MYLERLFAGVGTRISSNLIRAMITNVSPQLDETDPVDEEALSPKELKSRQRKLDSRKKKITEICKGGFKQFVNNIKKRNFCGATLNLVELTYTVPELYDEADFHTLLTLCYVALQKYGTAEHEEKMAKKANPKWKLLDQITDDIYTCGLVFIAEETHTTVDKMKVEQRLADELHWDSHNFKVFLSALGSVLKLENKEIWQSIEDEEPEIKLPEEATLDDLIIKLCDLVILPFYARLELTKIAGTLSSK